MSVQKSQSIHSSLIIESLINFTIYLKNDFIIYIFLEKENLFVRGRSLLPPTSPTTEDISLPFSATKDAKWIVFTGISDLQYVSGTNQLPQLTINSELDSEKNFTITYKVRH